MDGSAADTSLCFALHRDNKRKYKENTFTAKVESGTLKVKILRQDQKSVDNVVDTLSSTTSTKTRKRRATRQPQTISDSPPKPRPNRKHVPIFYEPQFRQPIKQRGGHSSSSMDNPVTHSTSSRDIHSTSSTEVSAASGTAGSTSSTSLKSVSPLSDGRLQSTSEGVVDVPSKMNQLSVRNDTNEPEVLNTLQQSCFPSSGSSGLHNVSLGGAQPAGTSLSAGLQEDQTIGLTSALHQLASSSALYRSALDKFSTSSCVQPSTLSSAVEPAVATAPLAATTTLAKTSDSTHNRTSEGMENYRFDPLSALQTAIDHARRVSPANESVNKQNDKHREIDSTNNSARVYRLEPSGICGKTHNTGNTSTATRLGVLPEFSPSLTQQNSLLGGGIQHPTYSKLPVNGDGNIVSAISDDSNKDTIAELGPPPDAAPSFLLQNSRTGGSMSVLDLPRTHPSLDRTGSLPSLISQENETAQDLNSAQIPESRTHLSLDRLVSMTSLTSEDSGSGKSMSLTASRPSASTSDTGSVSSNTIQDTMNNGAVDLGPPPSGPPAFTIGNSLMGGGIELQPAAANVNTHNFDWKLHRAVSNTSDDATFSSEVSREISHALRARLERSLISSENTTDKA